VTDRVFIPLPDGRWLGLTREQVAEAEQAGRELHSASTPANQAQAQQELLTAASGAHSDRFRSGVSNIRFPERASVRRQRRFKSALAW
jgi:hypothetical protein